MSWDERQPEEKTDGLKVEGFRVNCEHNQGLNFCHDRHCGTCGWNPAVAKKRLEKMRERKR